MRDDTIEENEGVESLLTEGIKLKYMSDKLVAFGF